MAALGSIKMKPRIKALIEFLFFVIPRITLSGLEWILFDDQRVLNGQLEVEKLNLKEITALKDLLNKEGN